MNPATYQTPAWRWRWLFYVGAVFFVIGAGLAVYAGAWADAVIAAALAVWAGAQPVVHRLVYETGYENGILRCQQGERW